MKNFSMRVMRRKLELVAGARVRRVSETEIATLLLAKEYADSPEQARAWAVNIRVTFSRRNTLLEFKKFHKVDADDFQILVIVNCGKPHGKTVSFEFLAGMSRAGSRTAYLRPHYEASKIEMARRLLNSVGPVAPNLPATMSA